jgi:hypothetical protein
MKVPPPEKWHHNPQELRDFLEHHEITQVAAAGLVGVDGRVMRRWLQDPSDKGAREMPYTAFYTLVHRAQEQGLLKGQRRK